MLTLANPITFFILGKKISDLWTARMQCSEPVPPCFITVDIIETSINLKNIDIVYSTM